MIHSKNNYVRILAVVGLRRLLSRQNPPIQAIIDADLIPVLLDILMYKKIMFCFEAGWCLTNIASGTKEHVAALIENGAIPYFVELLDSPFPEVAD